MCVDNNDEISMIERAAEQRYPYDEGTTMYFRSVQNSRRGDFCDGAMWLLEHGQPLWLRMYEALVKVTELYEPEDKEDKQLFAEIEDIGQEIGKIKIERKIFDSPTYPIKPKKTKVK